MKHGRINAISHLSATETQIAVQAFSGAFSFNLTPEMAEDLRVGDIVEVDIRPAAPSVRVLTPTLRPGSLKWNSRILDSRRLKALKVRAAVEAGIREFFTARDFLETRTPLLVPSPGMEIHIRPFQLSSGAFLPTSPEFAMKRLLVGGLEKIFQVCPSFRSEPKSSTHHPEFTMLEWYRAYDTLETIQKDTESLVEFLANKLNGKPEIQFQGNTISVKTPWPRLRVRDLYRGIGIELPTETCETLHAHCRRLSVSTDKKDTWDDLYFRIWLNVLEPSLPKNHAVFIERYPPSQAALAVLDRDPDGSVWAKRFEFYIAGLELGNAFEELTDAQEQRARFIRDMEERKGIYGDRFLPSPLDEDFLGALEEGLPPSGGIAVGVDRLVMLLADEPVLEKTIWLESFPSKTEG